MFLRMRSDVLVFDDVNNVGSKEVWVEKDAFIITGIWWNKYHRWPPWWDRGGVMNGWGALMSAWGSSYKVLFHCTVTARTVIMETVSGSPPDDVRLWLAPCCLSGGISGESESGWWLRGKGWLVWVSYWLQGKLSGPALGLAINWKLDLIAM